MKTVAPLALTLLLAGPASATSIDERFDGQVAETQRATTSAIWLGAGGLAFVLGLVPLFALRQGFDPPPRGLPSRGSIASLPDSISPALAGALVAGGRPSLEHAAASILALAEQGDLRVEEARGALGTRAYLLGRHASGLAIAPHEEAALDTMFRSSGPGTTVTLSKARARLVRRFRGFTRAVVGDLEAAGLIDHARQATRTAYLKAAGWLFGLGAVSVAVWPLLMEPHGAWPLAIPAALAGAAIVALILRGTSTPLSNEGVLRADRWRAYRDYLKSVAKQADGLSAVPAAALPYAVALGLASEWSKHFKAHPTQAPLWFHSGGDGSGYAAFIAAAGAGHSHHAH